MPVWVGVTWLGVIAAAYLLGSVPSGLVVGRLIFGIDPRDYGSRRTGATNVLRTMGKKAAIVVTLMDLAKGVVAVSLARLLLPGEPWAHVLTAFAAAAGHNWPIFSGFRGGKGVVVSGAGVGMLYWPVFAILMIVGPLLVWRTRYVSVGSMGGAISAPISGLYFYLRGMMPGEYLVYMVAAAVLVVWTHRENIARLRAGNENRVGQRVQTQPETQPAT